MSERKALVLVFHRRQGISVLWRGLEIEEAKKICRDDRTKGDNFFLGWQQDFGEKILYNRLGKQIPWIRDDRRFDELLQELGIDVSRIERRVRA